MANVGYGVWKQGWLFWRQPRSAEVVKCVPSSTGCYSHKEQQGRIEAPFHSWAGKNTTLASHSWRKVTSHGYYYSGAEQVWENNASTRSVKIFSLRNNLIQSSLRFTCSILEMFMSERGAYGEGIHACIIIWSSHAKCSYLEKKNRCLLQPGHSSVRCLRWILKHSLIEGVQLKADTCTRFGNGNQSTKSTCK